MASDGWVVVIFENEHRKFDGEVAYVKGPFEKYEDAEDWAENDEAFSDGEFQCTFIERKAAA